MVVMRWILYGLATWALLIGLWNHDWRLIVASVAIWTIFPLISKQIDDEAALDESWGEACVCGEINSRHCPVHGQDEHAESA